MSDYADLGLQHGALLDDVKKAFRSLAMKYHPDRPGGDEARFKRISAAYSRLQKVAPAVRQNAHASGSEVSFEDFMRGTWMNDLSGMTTRMMNDIQAELKRQQAGNMFRRPGT